MGCRLRMVGVDVGMGVMGMGLGLGLGRGIKTIGVMWCLDWWQKCGMVLVGFGYPKLYCITTI